MGDDENYLAEVGEKANSNEDEVIPSASLSAEHARELSNFADDVAIKDAEFTETPNAFKAGLDKDDDDGETITAEVVEKVKPVEVAPASVEIDKFKTFLSGLKPDLDVTLIVKRLPDHGLRFRIPYPSGPPKQVRNEYWDGRAAEEIYEVIIHQEGGGRYNIQSQYGGGMREAWTVVLDDPAEPSVRELTMRGEAANEREAERIADASPQFAATQPPPKTTDTIDELLAQATKFKQLKDALKDDAPPPPPAPVIQEQMSVKDQVILKIADKVIDSEVNGGGAIGTPVLQKLFGIGGDQKRTMGDVMTDVAYEYMTSPEKLVTAFGAIAQIAGLAGPAINGLLGRRPTPPNVTIVPPGAMVAAPQQQPSGIVMPPPVASVEAPQPEIAVTQPGESPMQQTPPVAPQADEFSGARW